MSQTPGSYPQEVNLENCAKEPIHIIGRTQAHGVLLVCDPSTFKINQAGLNCNTFFSISSEELLDQPLSFLLKEDQVEQLQEALKINDLSAPLDVHVDGKKFLMLAHLSEENLILDFEPVAEVPGPLLFQKQLTRILNRFAKVNSVEMLCDAAVNLCREIFGYDRVMIYKFDEDWNGEVLAESNEDGMESWLGLHYPASDIPAQSREMFLKQRVRIITDVNYVPVPIEPELSPVTGKPVDLTPSGLRAVSPIHIEYLQNMKVGASLTAAIVVKGELWGLITCHHRTKKFLDHYQRESCRFLVQMLSTEITLQENNQFLKRTKVSEGLRRRLVTKMRQNNDIAAALCEGKVRVTDLVDCGGAAVIFIDRMCLCGKTPSQKQVQDLLQNFLMDQPKSLFYTRKLSAVFPEAADYADVASGVLSLRIAENKYIIWFRPEEVENVTWGGNPEKKAFFNKEENRISPRKSFEKWTERLTGTSQPWQDFDLSVARSLRENISHIVLAKQRKEIEALNDRLIAANEELELFSYGLSHDLRAPIRGMQGLVSILEEDHSAQMDNEAKELLRKIQNLINRMNVLIDDILEYSSLNKDKGLDSVEINTGELIHEVFDFFHLSENYPEAELEVQEELPPMYGDKRMIFQLWANLINNAFKYSAETREQKISIGCITKHGNNVFFVRDNGIGIKNEFLEKIFGTFTRVAGGRYSGSGIGLAIAKKVTEKHHGRIWAESDPGKETTFYFYLGQQKTNR